LMAIPNLIGLVLLTRTLVKGTQSFEEGIQEGSIQKLD
jgi:Na+/alanine symporter